MSWLQTALEQQVGEDAVPGLTAVVIHGDDEQRATAGVLTLGGAAVGNDSLFRIASLTKPITAAVTMAMIERGVIGLEDEIRRCLPELAERRVLVDPAGGLEDTIAAEREITVRDLLTFTQGIGIDPRSFAASEPWSVIERADALQLHTFGPPDPANTPDPDTWIARLGSLPLVAQPGERWLYNTGSSILGVLLDRLTDSSFPELMRETILDPLGMNDTDWYASGVSRLATAYQPTPQGLVVDDPPDGAWSSPPAFADGGAGLVSTAEDVATFGRMLLRGGPVSRESLAAMMSDQLTPAQKAHGGLGTDFSCDSWGFGGAVITSGPKEGSYGWMGGLGTLLHVDPQRELVVVVCGQREFAGPDDSARLTAIEDAAYAALLGF